MYDYSKLPEHMREGTRRYIEDGGPPGGFLKAVICNDLMEALSRADDINRDRILDFVRFFRWEVPADCWGSMKKMEAWIKKHQ